MFALRKHFFDYGWLLPGFFPVITLLGRAPTNIFLVLYFVWGCLALYKSNVNIDKKWFVILGTVLLAFGLSIIAAHDPALAFKKWVHVGTRMSAFIFVLAVLSLESHQKKLPQFLKYMGIGGLIGLIGLYAKLLLAINDPGFSPNIHLKEDFLPLLLPFILYWVSSCQIKTYLKFIIGTVIVLSVAFYIVLSSGRAAFLGLTISLILYSLLVLRWRLQWFLLSGIALLTAAIFIVGPHWFTRGAFEHNTSLEATLSALTANRSELWLKALQHPPRPLFTGVGMGNAMYATDVSWVGAGEVRGLHNFILNLWYETGIFGLISYLIFLGVPLFMLLRKWANLDLQTKQIAGVLLASSFAILTSGLLSFSYASIQFSLFLSMCLAGLISLQNENHILEHKPI